MSSNKIQVNITETGESPYAVDIKVNGHFLKGDESLDAGGGNLGPSPFELLTSALGECTAMTIRWYAIHQNWPLEKVSVNVIYYKEDKKDYFVKEIIIIGDKLTDDQRQKLIEVAAKCPVQRTLEGTPHITTLGNK